MVHSRAHTHARCTVFGTMSRVQKARTAGIFLNVNAAAVLAPCRPRVFFYLFRPGIVVNRRVRSRRCVLPGDRRRSERRGVRHDRRHFGATVLSDGIEGHAQRTSVEAVPCTVEPFNDGLQLDLIFKSLRAVGGRPGSRPAAPTSIPLAAREIRG